MMYKPLVPYSAKDIGSFFLKFYLIVVIFGVFWVHFFISHEYFCQFLEFRSIPNATNIRTQSHNLYVRASNKLHCVGLNDEWSPALHAEVLSHSNVTSNTTTTEMCYDCQQNQPFDYLPTVDNVSVSLSDYKKNTDALVGLPGSQGGKKYM